eukprot:scaffold5081_cov110-Skeletonema_marinoi.AAC.1
MPTNNETIYDKNVVKIDKETTAELKSFMAKLPGHVNVAMDGEGRLTSIALLLSLCCLWEL